MKLSHLFSLSFVAAIFTGLAVTNCQHSAPIYDAPEYALERLHKGQAYVIDSGLTWEDCESFLRFYPGSYQCVTQPARKAS